MLTIPHLAASLKSEKQLHKTNIDIVRIVISLSFEIERYCESVYSSDIPIINTIIQNQA